MGTGNGLSQDLPYPGSHGEPTTEKQPMPHPEPSNVGYSGEHLPESLVWVAHASHSGTWKAEIRVSQVQVQPGLQRHHFKQRKKILLD